MDRPEVERKLAAILCADVVGYSRLMQEDDQATLRALTERRAVFAAQVDAAGGRIVNAPGDSVLAEFASVVSAVQCAVNIQRAIVESNSGLPESRRMQYRIGVNLGDVLSDAAGIYGDGVNIAARLESLAPAGGICVSQPVRDQVRSRLALDFEDMGEQKVKNIAEPVRVFRVAGEAAPVAPEAAAKPAPPSLPDLPSIAVLPFNNLSGDPEQEYFADGMVEDILTALARTGMFFVIARNSSFVYKGHAVNIQQVGRELGVRYVLEGSIRKAGNRIRIAGQLIEAESGRHVWADRFEGTLEDVFELQDRITESVVFAIEPGVRRAELERIRVKPTNNLQAYDYLLQALPGLSPGTSKAGKDASSSFIRRALEMDPGFSLAKAAGAFACIQRVIEGYGQADDVKSGLRFAEEALADHKDNPVTLSLAGLALGMLGYRALGFRVLGFRYEEALRAIDRAFSLSPNLFVVLIAAGYIRLIVGDGDAAIAHFERAIRLSPLDPGMSALIVGTCSAHITCGRYEDALAAAQRAIEVDPKFASAHRVMIFALGLLGRVEEAKLSAQRMLELTPDFTVSRYSSVFPAKDANMRKRNAELLRAAGVPN
ncbi:MAG: adenylate/guanylate cyclase domain-containing protein [Burkholderiales bacterium]